MKQKNILSRARVDRPVNRIEFNRLQPAVDSAPEVDASGASDSVRENKSRIIRSGSKGSHLRSAGKESVGSPFKRSSGESSTKTLKSPQSAPARAEETPAAKSSVRSAKKVSKSSSKKSSGGKAAKNRRHSAPAVADPFLSTGEAQASSDEMSEGRSPSPPPSSASERSSEGSASREESPPAQDQASSSVVCDGDVLGGKDLNFDAPDPCVSAATGGRHRDRILIVSKEFPIPDEQREEFAKFVRSFDWQDQYWDNIPSTVARKLALKYLRWFLTPCSAHLAEQFLQLSYIVHQRFVAGDDDTPAEHFAIACAIGQMAIHEEDSYRADVWEHHDISHLFNAGGSERGSSSSSKSSERRSPGLSASGKSSSGKSKRVRVTAPVVPQGGSSVDEARLTSKAPGGTKTTPVVVKSTSPPRDAVPTAYLDKLAAEVATVTARFHAEQQRLADQTSTTSNLALDKVIDDLRASLPTALAEAAISGLLSANDRLREPSKPDAPAKADSSAAELGRSYRVGQLSAEDRHLAHRMNRVGARVATKDGSESHCRQHDRVALLNSDDRDVLFTLRKVMRGSGEFSHLDSQQKMKAMARLVRRQLHEADLERVTAAAERSEKEAAGKAAREAVEKADKNAAAAGVKKSAADVGGENDSSSSGDSCSRSSDDSREDIDSYERDSFCASDGEGGGGDGRDGDGGGDGDDGSDSDKGSDSDGGSGDDDTDGLNKSDKRRAERRRESSNSLGTPATKSRGKVPLATPAPSKAVDGDRPSLVLLGDEDLALWKSGLPKYKMGFHWESYLYHKQQFDNYKAHRGRFSDRTFRSIIDAKLVPTVCASCGFFRSRWATLSDARLILKIERVLRPSKSTDFAMELKEIRIESFTNEPLQASYITFAEKFLTKVAEAADAGRPVKPVVVKAAFKSAVDKEVPLKTWLEGDKWRGVDHAHRRLLRKLREARSWEAMTLATNRKKAQRPTSDDPVDGGADHPRRGFRSGGPNGGKRRSNATGNGVRKRRGNATRVKRANASTGFNGGGKRDSGGGKRDQRPRAEKLRTWKGCDSRGDSWHTDKDLFECFKKPCQASFCQRCAKHGHTADYCQVPEGTEGVNTSGYFQEARPGKAGPKRPPARNNSSNKRRGNADGSSEGESEDAYSQSDGDSGRGCHTARRNNSSRGQRGRGRL